MIDLSVSYIRHLTYYISYVPIEAQTRNYKIARWLSKGYSSYNVFLDGVNDVPYIIIADVWTCRQTHTNLK